MILQALADYYEVLAAQGKVARPGWSSAKVIGALCLDENGVLTDILSLKQADARGKERPVVKSVPEQAIRASGIKANFLCDGPGYLLGLDAKGNAKRARGCFDAAAALHLSLLEGVDSPAARAVYAFFTNWNPDAAHPVVEAQRELLSEPGSFVFRVQGVFAHEDGAIRAAWEQHRAQNADGPVMQCAVTGRYAPAARLHTPIKGVRGAQSSGAALVSYNADAFTSYGQEQSYNASVSESAMFAYTTALNHLLADKTHTAFLGDTTVIAWSANGEPLYNDIALSCLLDSPAPVSDEELTALLEALVHGKPYDFGAVTIDPAEPFYLLGLSPNAARLSVRFFWRNTFGQLARNLQAHQARLEIVRPAFDTSTQLSVGQLLWETVNKKSKDKAAPPVLVGGLMQAILNNTPYPAALRTAVMLRIRAERGVTRGQAALLKAIKLKNSTSPEVQEVCTVGLNEETNYLPYVLGRLFSVLEAIQSAANPNINTTIKDKYFVSAAATPATIFSRLTALSQAHLRKLETGARISFEKQLTALYGLLPAQLPARLTLSEQESFYIGYYQQTQKRFTKKED